MEIGAATGRGFELYGALKDCAISKARSTVVKYTPLNVNLSRFSCIFLANAVCVIGVALQTDHLEALVHTNDLSKDFDIIEEI